MIKYILLAPLLLITLLSRAQNKPADANINGVDKPDTITGLQKIPKSLAFCVIGDWGRHGEAPQLAVAKQLGIAATGVKASFIISTGDNFYPDGVVSEFDPSLQSSFENVYTAHSTHVPWYVVLGNHDYKINPDAEVAYSKISARWKMPARYFSVVKTLSGDTAKKAAFFFIDSSPFQAGYYKEEDYAANVSKADTAAQKAWLEDALKNSTATWKFVVGHHPLYSAGGRKGKTQDMENSFKALFEKYKVDAYICGHEHQLEYDVPADVHFVQFISGAGSEATPVTSAPYAKFVMQQYGLLTASITPGQALFQFVSWDAKVLYTTTLKK